MAILADGKKRGQLKGRRGMFFVLFGHPWATSLSTVLQVVTW